MQPRLWRPSNEWSIIFCGLSIVLLGFAVTQIQHRHRSHGYINQALVGLKCPIPKDAKDVCIHSDLDMRELGQACGTVTSTIGHCQNRFYDLIVTPIHAIDAVSEHTHKMIVHGVGIGTELDAFVQRKSRWVIDLMGAGSRYEVLTTFEDKERVELQGLLDQLQNRCDRFFRGAINPFGFGSEWHNMGLGLAYGLYYNMTLFTPDKHNYFIPMTTCTEDQMKDAFSKHPPETNYSLWNPSTVNYDSVGIDVQILLKNSPIILQEYAHKGHFWWRSMLTYYAVRPNTKLREILRSKLTFPTPCISIHVRHSDKHYEATLIDMPAYMEKAKAYKDKTGISDIFLMTDDDAVIQATKDYPEFRFHYMDVPRTNKGWQADTNAGISRDQQEINFLVDVFSATQCQHSIVTYSSNVGRLIAEIMYATHNKEPDVVSMDTEWQMAP